MESALRIDSPFAFMTPEVRAQWEARGLDLDAVIISAHSRDADPCQGFNGSQCAAEVIDLP